MASHFHEERAPLAEALRDLRDRPGPGLALVRGEPGAGVTTLLNNAFGDSPHLRFPLSPLADQDQRALLRSRLNEEWPADDGLLRDLIPSGLGVRALTPGPPDLAAGPWHWDWLIASLGARSPEGDHPLIVVLEDLEHLGVGVERFARAVAHGWESVRRHSPRVLLILTTRNVETFRGLADPGGDLYPLLDQILELHPLTLRGTSAALARWEPRRRLEAWTLLGGNPGRLALLEMNRSLGANIRDLVLDPAGPLHREMERHLIRSELSQPGRYGSLLRTVALGGNSWSRIREAFPGEGGSGRPGPYANRLRELGMIQVEQSLDAPARSRSRRYSVTDPLLETWYRWVLPALPDLRAGRLREVWKERIRPRLLPAMCRGLPRAAKGILHRGAATSLGSTAREVGSLWGPGYEIPVAGVLRNAAAFYALTAGPDEVFFPSDLDGLDGAIRETRYGFGRERRVRLLISWDPVSDAMEAEVARREFTRVLGRSFLLGEHD